LIFKIIIFQKIIQSNKLKSALLVNGLGIDTNNFRSELFGEASRQLTFKKFDENKIIPIYSL